jgi:hypothetical protein
MLRRRIGVSKKVISFVSCSGLNACAYPDDDDDDDDGDDIYNDYDYNNHNDYNKHKDN